MPQSTDIDMVQLLLRDGSGVSVFYGDRWRSKDWMADSAAVILEASGGDGAMALVARNLPHHIAAMAGAIDARRPFTMIHSAQSSARLAADIRRLRRSAIIAERSDWTEQTLAAAREVGSAAIAVSDGPDCCEVDVLEPRRGNDFAEPAQNTAVELLSSGTTGPPKQIALSRFTVAKTLGATAQIYASSEKQAPQVMCAPLGNVSGLAYALPPLLNDQPLVLLEKFRPSDWTQAVRDHKPRRGSMTPAGVA